MAEKKKSSNRGGRRPGAGRPKGACDKRKLALIAQVEKELGKGDSPLEILLKAMRLSWRHGNIRDAANYARWAAPYFHPQLRSVEHTSDGSGGNVIIVTGVPDGGDD